MIDNKEKEYRIGLLLDLITQIPNNELLMKKDTLEDFLEIMESSQSLHSVNRAVFRPSVV